MERAPGSDASPVKKIGSEVKLCTLQHCPSSVENLSSQEKNQHNINKLMNSTVLFLYSLHYIPI